MQKARAALIVILDFISGKLLESISWVLLAAVTYILFVVFYSNMVLFGNISLRVKGLEQVAYTLGFVLTAAVFVLFAVLAFLYIAFALLALFRAPGAPKPVPPKFVEDIKKQKLFTYVKNLWDNLGKAFSWKAPGTNRNLYLLLILSLTAFYHSWLHAPKLRLAAYKYHIFPDFLLVTAKEFFRGTYPYISPVIKYVTALITFTYKMIVTWIDKLI